MAITILFVDSDREILTALDGVFMESSYQRVLMTSYEDAMAYVTHNPVEMVVSDIRQQVNGLDFLRQVKARYPETIRVVLGTSADSRAIYKALEENTAKMYVFKSSDNRGLLGVVDKIFQMEAVLRDKKIMDLINNLDELPTIPSLYTRIKQMIQEDEDVAKIAGLIEADQATTANILRIANSAFFGAKTGSITQAIMYIGLSNVKSIILSNAVFNTAGPMGASIKELWQNATLTNRLTNHLYHRITGKKIPNVFASAGLLHNIGMVILISHFTKVYAEILASGATSLAEQTELEKKLIGVTHQELGGYLLNWWELPLPIVEAALYHNTPLDEGVINRELVCCVHLASTIAGERMGTKPAEGSPFEACCTFLKTDPETIKGYAEELDDLEVRSN